MLQVTYKKVVAAIFAGFLLISAVYVYALPGITSYLSDDSGLYVYYRDYSFGYEAYIGFLQYDDSTYAMRYYSPVHPVADASVGAVDATEVNDGMRSALPKSIEILFTLKPDVPYTEMTGERFVTIITADDTDLVNYMHDLVYEFSSRRRKLPESIVTAQTVCREDFPQFGGTILMTYDFDVPLFGLKHITMGDGTVLFDLVTVGLLVSSADTSFSAFKGFPSPLNDKRRSFSPAAKPIAYPVEFGSQKIQLDSQWTNVAENMFLLGDNAILTISAFDAPSELTKSGDSVFDLFTRSLSLGTQGSYADWRQRTIKRSSNRLDTEITYYIPAENAVSHDFKILTKINDGRYCILSLTVFDSVYKNNKTYFDTILKSYSCF